MGRYTCDRTWMDRRRYYRRQYHLAHHVQARSLVPWNRARGSRSFQFHKTVFEYLQELLDPTDVWASRKLCYWQWMPSIGNEKHARYPRNVLSEYKNRHVCQDTRAKTCVTMIPWDMPKGVKRAIDMQECGINSKNSFYKIASLWRRHNLKMLRAFCNEMRYPQIMPLLPLFQRNNFKWKTSYKSIVKPTVTRVIWNCHRIGIIIRTRLR